MPGIMAVNLCGMSPQEGNALLLSIPGHKNNGPEAVAVWVQGRSKEVWTMEYIDDT